MDSWSVSAWLSICKGQWSDLELKAFRCTKFQADTPCTERLVQTLVTERCSLLSAERQVTGSGYFVRKLIVEAGRETVLCSSLPPLPLPRPIISILVSVPGRHPRHPPPQPPTMPPDQSLQRHLTDRPPIPLHPIRHPQWGNSLVSLSFISSFVYICVYILFSSFIPPAFLLTSPSLTLSSCVSCL